MQNVIKINYVVKSFTVNGRTSGRTQIVILVQTQGSCNSTILKLILEKGIYFLASISGQHGWYERKFHLYKRLCNPPLSIPDHAKVSNPAEDYILTLHQYFLIHPTACVSKLYMKEIFAKTTLAAS